MAVPEFSEKSFLRGEYVCFTRDDARHVRELDSDSLPDSKMSLQLLNTTWSSCCVTSVISIGYSET